MKGAGLPACVRCGAEHKDRARFCQNCGVEIAAEPAPERQAANGYPENAASPGLRTDPAAFSQGGLGVAVPEGLHRLEGWTSKTIEQLREQVDRGVLGSLAMTQGTVLDIKPGTDWKSGGFSKGYELKQIIEITYSSRTAPRRSPGWTLFAGRSWPSATRSACNTGSREQGHWSPASRTSPAAPTGEQRSGFCDLLPWETPRPILRTAEMCYNTN